MRQSMSNSPRRSIAPRLKLAPRISYTDWVKAQTIINALSQR